MENSLNQLFSELIMLQRNEQLDPFDLSETAPIMKPVHPKMIRALLNFMDNPEQEVTSPVVPGKFFAFYANTSEAKNDFPQITVVKGLPYQLFESKGETTLFDFAPFGAAVISDSTLSCKGSLGIHQQILPPFLEYALSSELWGNQGKWTRFHERLHNLFSKFNLLNEKSSPGRYPLKAQAVKQLEKKGIKGTFVGNSFVLFLPWTFPLSALDRLEAIIQEEF